MIIQNRIKKRLANINQFAKSKNRTKTKAIHRFRLEVKKLEAYLELLDLQKNCMLQQEIPDRLVKLYHEAGKGRKFSLELDAVRTMSRDQAFSKPEVFMDWLLSSKKKTNHKLAKKSRALHNLKVKGLVKYPNTRISHHEWHRFLVNRADCMLELLALDLLTDLHSIHQLRKLIKSVLYIQPLIEKPSAVYSFIESRKDFLKQAESKIGSLHDHAFFLEDLEKMPGWEQSPECTTLEKIKKGWQENIESLKEDIQKLFPEVQQFALELKK